MLLICYRTLKKCSQRVKVHGKLGNFLAGTSGVLFYLNLIEDILDLQDSSSCFCYANDTKFLATVSDLNQNSQVILDVLKIYNQYTDNQLRTEF